MFHQFNRLLFGAAVFLLVFYWLVFDGVQFVVAHGMFVGML